jgi:hypothetical protein
VHKSDNAIYWRLTYASNVLDKLPSLYPETQIIHSATGYLQPASAEIDRQQMIRASDQKAIP